MSLNITFINVGYGESILIRCPIAQEERSYTMLIDGGSAEPAEYAGHPFRVRAADYLESVGVTKLDLLVNTHIHEDHTSGLYEVAKRFPIEEYWCCALPKAARDWGELPERYITTPATGKSLHALNDHRLLMQHFFQNGVSIRSLYRQERPMKLADGFVARVIGPLERNALAMCDRLDGLYREKDTEEAKKRLAAIDADMNNHSVMLLLEYFGTRILLPGDTNRAGYKHLLKRDLAADVFKVGHHGQRDGADAQLLAAVSPKVVAVCASSDRRYESMHPDILGLVSKLPNKPQLVLSDVPDLPPWTDGVMDHRASELLISESGEIRVQYAE